MCFVNSVESGLLIRFDAVDIKVLRFRSLILDLIPGSCEMLLAMHEVPRSHSR